MTNDTDPFRTNTLGEAKVASDDATKNNERGNSMNRTTHTPGPWSYEYTPYISQDGEEIPAFQIHGIAKISETNESRPQEEQEANARLIAAAPDLLAALEAQAMAEADPEASERKGYFDRARDLRRAALANAGRMVW